MYNRVDKNLALSIDGAAEYGPTFSPQLPVSVAGTGGIIIGWASSDVNQVASGDSLVASGTLPGEIR